VGSGSVHSNGARSRKIRAGLTNRDGFGKPA
jgi:hypothetical protein